jgi:diaminohydroxyphosphoribosylaminopyrimidine deaminase / 5-amino-6-(5-phosphoribosylamino)uracil reductase
MKTQEKYMEQCLELAERGIGYVSPNPMVGCVIVEGKEIIGEGFHKEFGKEHAEVNAINSVKDKSRLKNATLYVNLEPCNHYGKTPPCTELIINSGIKKVVICNVDTNPLVGGSGIKKLKDAGVEVVTGVLEEKGRFVNRRFFTFHEKERPYIILKWAQTKDGFMSKLPVPENREENIISGSTAQWLVHVWRSHEMGIMVGTNTVRTDNPFLTVRHLEGKNPLKIVLDRTLKINADYHVFDPEGGVLFFVEKIYKDDYKGPRKEFTKFHNLEWVVVDFENDLIENILTQLYRRNITSVLVEGGKMLHETFLASGLYDEIRVLESEKKFGSGLKAPEVPIPISEEMKIGEDELRIYYNRTER